MIFWERCRTNEGELVWSLGQLEMTQQAGRKTSSKTVRQLFMEIEQWIRKTFRKTHPELWVGPKAARAKQESQFEKPASGREIRCIRCKSSQGS